ncbi:phage head spike fiber domain-containing protein [Spirosoma litoris]
MKKLLILLFLPLSLFAQVTVRGAMSLFTPSLNLDFTKGVMPSGLTFTRNSVGTYFDASGVMQTATANTPRFDYDPVSLAIKGLLIEESRTNILIRSAELDNSAVWGRSTAVLVTPNAINGPDGTLSADKIIQTTINGRHTIVYPSITLAASTSYVASIYVKAGEINRFCMLADNGGITPSAYYNTTFNLTNGTISAGSTALSSIVSVGNGWYRCSIGFNSNTTTTGFQMSYIVGDGTGNVTGDGVSGLYLWGAQLEAGAFITSYIPTLGAAVLRSADVCTLPIGSWFNQQQSSWYAEFMGGRTSNQDGYGRTIGVVGSNAEFVSSNAPAGNNITLYPGTGGNARSVNIPTTIGTVFTSFVKAACSYDNTTLLAFVTSRGISASGGLGVAYPTISSLSIGSQSFNNNVLNGYIRRITYYPRLIPNSYLQALTN